MHQCSLIDGARLRFPWSSLIPITFTSFSVRERRLSAPSSHNNQLKSGPTVCRLTDPVSFVDGSELLCLAANSTGGIGPIVPCGRTLL